MIGPILFLPDSRSEESASARDAGRHQGGQLALRGGALRPVARPLSDARAGSPATSRACCCHADAVGRGSHGSRCITAHTGQGRRAAAAVLLTPSGSRDGVVSASDRRGTAPPRLLLGFPHGTRRPRVFLRTGECKRWHARVPGHTGAAHGLGAAGSFGSVRQPRRAQRRAPPRLPACSAPGVMQCCASGRGAVGDGGRIEPSAGVADFWAGGHELLHARLLALEVLLH